MSWPGWLSEFVSIVPIACLAVMLCVATGLTAAAAETERSAAVVSLDGPWSLAPDPKNVGRDQRWWERPVPDAKPTPVPWIIQEVFPGAHGVAWYWRDFTAPTNPHAHGRYLLRFWAVDYRADVWLNGVHVGKHEGGEDPFVLDVTEAIKPQAANRLAVRVLNPSYEPIDGIVLGHTPRRNKTHPYTAGSDYNYGGITDSVELLIAAPVRVGDLFVRPDPRTGTIRVQANLRNAGPQPAKARVVFTVAPAASGESLDVAQVQQELPVADTPVEAVLRVPNPHLWELNDPYLYRVTARVTCEGSAPFDEQSTRCGFRDFRLERGYFRLNGRRIYLKSSHTGADTPVGIRVAYDRDLLRKDLLNCKVMGFNMIRFIAGVAQRYQLELCDEIGLLVYEENFASWCLGDSPQMGERFDHSTLAMVKRDRNHPSIVLWGLLNETGPGSVFFRAVNALPKVRALDETRAVLLNSGGFDGYTRGSKALGPSTRRVETGLVPNVTKNILPKELFFDGTTWPPGVFALHPGINGEYSVVRWTAPAAGEYTLAATFSNIVVHGVAKTDTHIFHRGQAIYDGFINLHGFGGKAEFTKTLKVEQGDTIDVVVGIGDDRPFGDTTALAMTIKSTGGQTHDVAADFSTTVNPNGVWTYGWLAGGPKPGLATFKKYPVGEGETRASIGRIANPGSTQWEDILSDQHPYQSLPHNAGVIKTLRTVNGGEHPLWLSEYGIGSALDLVRLARHYEQLGKTHCEDAVAYRQYLDLFLADWQRWNMADTFASPEDYFRQCLAWMAGLRLLGINAIRANPSVIGYSLTGTQDQGLTGEGLTTTFRELKPGTIDAMFEAFYPLRWCLFVEPVQVYRGKTAHFEAVLANEDRLPPGEYPVRLQVVGPKGTSVLDRTVKVVIPDTKDKPELPFAMPVFAEEVTIDGPAGRYRFLATFQSGAAAAGGEVEFYVADPAEMPRIETEVVLWGDDPHVAAWLAANGIKTRPFAPGMPTARELILVGNRPAADEAEAFRELARHLARGSSAVFLSPEIFKKGDAATGWLPLANKGSLIGLPVWVYHKDDWAKRHTVFEGLPAGGLLDHTFYREVLPNLDWSGQEVPAEVVAGSINTSCGYNSGLLVSVYEFAAGRFLLNTLRIRENLGRDPVAERLLRNMLRHASRDLSKPLTDLPADFDQRLKAIRYGG
jgi:hypothetical protein